MMWESAEMIGCEIMLFAKGKPSFAGMCWVIS